MKWSKDEIDFLIENYPNGSKSCVEYLNRDIKSVRLKAGNLKIKVNKDAKFLIYSESNKKKWAENEKPLDKYKFDFTNFINITTPEVAYTLGFMWGDGYLQSLGISKTNRVYICNNLSSDISLIKYIFEKTGKWNIYNHTNRRKKMISVCINNKPFCEYLISMDFDKKSHVSPNKILSIIPEEYINYFYLGLSDADGCFYINDKNYTNQYSLTSTINQDWTYMINLCENMKLKYSIRQVKKENKNKILNKYSQFRITNKTDIITFGNFIYKDYLLNKIGLDRKYVKFKEICEERIHKEFENKICPYCKKIGKGPNMTRYHFNNCKNKI